MIDEEPVVPPETTTLPTHPGVYWYRPVGLSSSLRLEVCLTEGELTVVVGRPTYRHADGALARADPPFHGTN